MMPHSVQVRLTRAQAEAVCDILRIDLEDNPDTEDRAQIDAAVRKIAAALDAVNSRHNRVSA